jgi:5-carboxymethyl-2-hydroxymuconate isomerase
MPHLILEYSANLDADVDVPAMVAVVHDAALETGVFPQGGIRTRAARRDIYRIADGHADNSFVHLHARIGAGRSVEARKAAGKHVFDALAAYLAPVMAARPLAISFEMSEINADTSFKKNNLHDILAKRAEASGP